MSKLIQQYVALEEAVSTAISQIAGFENIASEVLTRVVIQSINSYQQKLNVGIQDSVKDLLDEFKTKMTDAVFERSCGWKAQNREPFLFPRNCRFCFSKGSSTVFIIEQEPQVRSLLFEESMLDIDFDPSASRPQRVALALPYTYFILNFKNGVFSSAYTGWSTSAASSLDATICPPILPNIQEGMSICFGTGFSVQGTNMSERAESVLSFFWQSRFNNDLSANWWRKRDIDRRLISALRWADESIEDPMFVLNLQLPETGRKTLRQFIDLLTMHEQEPDENAFRHSIKESIEGCAEALFHKVLRYFKKTKFDKHCPKDITSLLSENMKTASAEVIQLVFAIENELGKIKREIESGRNKTVRPVSNYWSKYSA